MLRVGKIVKFVDEKNKTKIGVIEGLQKVGNLIYYTINCKDKVRHVADFRLKEAEDIVIEKKGFIFKKTIQLNSSNRNIDKLIKKLLIAVSDKETVELLEQYAYALKVKKQIRKQYI